MFSTAKLAKSVVLAGAAALIVTALLHMCLGFPFVERAISGSDLSSPVGGAFKAMWVAFSSHLFIVSCLLLIYAFKRGAPQKSLILLCGMIPVFDAILLTAWVSAVHVGVWLLSASGALILIGGGLTLFSENR